MNIRQNALTPYKLSGTLNGIFYKYKKKVNNSLVLLMYLAVSFIYFGKSIFTHRLLAFSDSFFEDYPLRLYYAHKFLENIDFHFWLPYEYLGLPLLGILHVGILYPFNFLYFFLPEAFVFNLNFILHYALAAFFTYLYVRLLAIRFFPAFVAGLIFGYSGYLLGYVKCFTSFRNAAIWLPLILYLYEMLRRTLGLRYVALGAIVIAIQVFAGHYQISVYTYLVVSLFVLYYFFKIENTKRIRFFFLSLCPLFFGSLIALPQLIATKELSDFAWRPGLGYDFFTEGSFSPILALSHLFPFTSELWPPSWPTAEFTLSPITPFAQLLAIWSFIKLRKEELHTSFWGLVAILALFLALGRYNPFYHLMYHLPVYNLFRIPARHLLEYNFAIAVLSAIGLNNLLYNPNSKNNMLSLIKIYGYASMLSLLLFILFKLSSTEPLIVRLFNPDTIFIFKNISRFSNKYVILTIASFSIFTILIYIKYKINTNSPVRNLASYLTFLIIPSIVIVNGFQFDRYWPEIYKIVHVNHLSNDSIFQYIKAHTPWDRGVFIVPHSQLYNIPAQVHTLNGYDPLITSNFAQLLYMTQHWSTSMDWPGLLQNNLILSTLNTRYVILHPEEKEMYGLERIQTVVGALNLRKMSPKPWESSQSKELEKGEFLLASPNGRTASWLQQRLSLHPNTSYLLSLEVCSPDSKPSEGLSFDLYGGPDYDSPVQELQVEPSEMKQDYRAFHKLINTGKNLPSEVDLRLFTFSIEPILVRNFELRELLSPPYIAGQESGSQRQVQPYTVLFETGEWVVYENKNCLSRAFTVSELDVADDITEVRKKFELFEFNPADTALVNQEDMAKIGRTNFVKGAAKIEEYNTDQIIINTEFQDDSGFLVLSDQYFPGWLASVDGQETPIYQVDGLLRGIVVPQGNHRVEFRYRPWNVYISGLVGFVTLFIAFIIVFRSPRPSQE